MANYHVTRHEPSGDWQVRCASADRLEPAAYAGPNPQLQALESAVPSLFATRGTRGAVTHSERVCAHDRAIGQTK